MAVQIDISGVDPQGRVFLTWAPVSATAKLVGDGPAAGPVNVVLRNGGTGGGLVFDTTRSDQGAATLPLTLPANGQPVNFWVAGEFQKPSSAYGDAIVQATDAAGNVLGSKAVMVRIRKNAQTLSAPERDRFLAALGTLNAQGQGAYKDFRDMHTKDSSREIHGNPSFLPWHRAYVLDLERALQAIDATVAVPYWRFDQAAPSVFTQDFMGEYDDDSDLVVFRPGHALEHWATDVQVGVTRRPLFNLNRAPNVLTEARTIALGGSRNLFAGFRGMEDNPHGYAHTSFDGPIDNIFISVGDPLFFMLHANVDRLWAKWQWVKHRQNPSDRDAYDPQPRHDLADTLWPWDGIWGSPRPPSAPGGPFPDSTLTPLPGKKPRVEDTFDHLGVFGGSSLGFAYDDVPYELPPVAVAMAPTAGTGTP